jgi:pimeloyl-ACP methyl ester carboxylesterase
MNLIDIQGVQLEVLSIKGQTQRAPIIFLHEGLGSVSLWTQRGHDWPLALCEKAGRAGVVYSRRGYGCSAPALRGSATDNPKPSLLPPDYMHREALEVLPALLVKLGINKPVLLGHSDGATIALLHASRFELAACVAMAPHVLVEDLSIKAIAEARVAFETTGLRERLARHHADVDGAFWQWNDVWLSPAFRSFDIRAECSRISAPLLLLQGLGDEYGSMRQLDEIARVAPHAQQLRLTNCGHSPQRDQPSTSMEAVAAFLEKLS